MTAPYGSVTFTATGNSSCPLFSKKKFQLNLSKYTSSYVLSYQKNQIVGQEVYCTTIKINLISYRYIDMEYLKYFVYS